MKKQQQQQLSEEFVRRKKLEIYGVKDDYKNDIYEKLLLMETIDRKNYVEKINKCFNNNMMSNEAENDVFMNVFLSSNINVENAIETYCKKIDGIIVKKMEKWYEEYKKKKYFKKHGFDENMLNNIVNEVTHELLVNMETNIDRNFGVKEINKYMNNIEISTEIERGIFCATLINIYQRRIISRNTIGDYFHELFNICANLDTNDKKINNQFLKYAILNKEISPFRVGFLTPQQMHIQRWFPYYQKRDREIEAINHVAAYKDYENKCQSCGGVDFYSYEQQLRSADEPASKFIVCLDCKSTILQL